MQFKKTIFILSVLVSSLSANTCENAIEFDIFLKETQSLENQIKVLKIDKRDLSVKLQNAIENNGNKDEKEVFNLMTQLETEKMKNKRLLNEKSEMSDNFQNEIITIKEENNNLNEKYALLESKFEKLQLENKKLKSTKKSVKKQKISTKKKESRAGLYRVTETEVKVYIKPTSSAHSPYPLVKDERVEISKCDKFGWCKIKNKSLYIQQMYIFKTR